MIKTMFFLLALEVGAEPTLLGNQWVYGPYPTAEACEEGGKRMIPQYDPSLSNIKEGATANGFVCLEGAGFLRDPKPTPRLNQ